MYICMYIYMSVCSVYVCVYACVYMYMYVYIYIIRLIRFKILKIFHIYFVNFNYRRSTSALCCLKADLR